MADFLAISSFILFMFALVGLVATILGMVDPTFVFVHSRKSVFLIYFLVFVLFGTLFVITSPKLMVKDQQTHTAQSVLKQSPLVNQNNIY